MHTDGALITNLLIILHFLASMSARPMYKKRYDLLKV